jgi:hypothetical protein
LFKGLAYFTGNSGSARLAEHPDHYFADQAAWTTNGSENDIRCHVTRRKVSGGTRSDRGRDARDTFRALAKTCAVSAIATPPATFELPVISAAITNVWRLPVARQLTVFAIDRAWLSVDGIR